MKQPMMSLDPSVLAEARARRDAQKQRIARAQPDEPVQWTEPGPLEVFVPVPVPEVKVSPRLVEFESSHGERLRWARDIGICQRWREGERSWGLWLQMLAARARFLYRRLTRYRRLFRRYQ